MQQEFETLDIGAALRTVRRRAALVVLCVALVAAAAYGFSRQQAKEYTATAALAFHASSLGEQLAGLSPESASGQFAEQLSNVELVGLGDMAARTGQALAISEAAVRNAVSVSGQGESNIVTVSATATSPALAAKIATVYAHQFVVERQRANRDAFKAALALVNKQIRELPRDQRFGAVAVPLESRAQSLRLLEGLKEGNVALAQPALPPTGPSSPKTLRNTILGGLIGLLLGIGLAFVLERINRARRIREPEDLEKIYGLTPLGAVPAGRALARADTAKTGAGRTSLPEVEAEAFQMIRARLRFSPGCAGLRSVLVNAAERGVGNTTVALGMAEAAARMGARTLLLEADLRNPVLAGRLGLRSGATLAGVLAGAVSVEAATRSVEVGPDPLSDSAASRAMDLLAWGSLPSVSPAEQLESQAMDAVLERSLSVYDFVVIDAPPLTVVSDGFSLLPKVDGVLIVSWIDRSTRVAAEQLRRTLAGSGTRQLGVVANGVRTGELSGYGGTVGYGSGVTPGHASPASNGRAPSAPVPTPGA